MKHSQEELIRKLESGIKFAEDQLEVHKKALAWFLDHAEFFATVDCSYINLCGKNLDINRPGPGETHRIMQYVGAGKWVKEYMGDAVNYTAELNGFQVRLYASPPPPCCHIVEEIVEVPARFEKRRRLVCKEEPAEATQTNEQKEPDATVNADNA